MKKYFLLLLILISMNSCYIGYNPADFSTPVIINKCEQSSIEGYSNYYGYTLYELSASASREFCFRDMSEKFNVGDTIKIIK